MTEPTSKTSPFVIAASIAVIIASIVGVGAMTGLLPGRDSKTEAPPAASAPAEPGKAVEEASTPPKQAMTARSDTASENSSKSATEEKAATKPVRKAAAKPAARSAESGEPPVKTQAPVCRNCGVITAIRTVEQAGEGSGLGAIAGGVVGGLLGHQVGGGTGKDLATIAGAVGGGYAGHQVEKKVKTTKHYEISIRMDDGSHRTMTQEVSPAFAIGDSVKIVDGALVRN